MASISEVGKTGEAIAANYLVKSGYEILDMNFSNELGYRRGEIDIVAKDSKNDELVFVEVKTRRQGLHSANPELAITKPKYRKLLKVISGYINKNNLHDRNWRLDAIAIEMDLYSKKAKLKHIKYIYY